MDQSAAAAAFPVRNGLIDTGCRALKAKTLCGTFFLNVVVFTIMSIILSVQGAQGSLQTSAEWPSSSESWGSSSLSSSAVHVAKRQTDATSQEKSTGDVDTSPKDEKSSHEAAADETPKSGPVTEGKVSGGSVDPKEGQATEGSAGQAGTGRLEWKKKIGKLYLRVAAVYS